MKRKIKKKHNLKHRFFLYFTGIIVSIMILTFSFFTMYIYRVNQQRFTGFLKNLTEVSASQLDTLIQNMDNEALQIIANPTTIEAFKMASESSLATNYFETDISLRSKFLANLTAINGPNMYANRINVYNNSGDYLSTGIYRESKKNVLDKLSSPEFYNHYQHILALNGDKIVNPPAPDSWGGAPNRILFSVAREIRDVHKSYGIVEIQHDSTLIDEIFSSFDRSTGIHVYVFADNTLIYPYTSIKDSSTATLRKHYMMATKEKENIVRKRNPITTEDEFITSSKLKNADWTVVFTQPYASLYADFHVTALISFIATLLTTAVSAILIYFVSSHLTKPLRQLTQKIDEINIINPSLSIEHKGASLYKNEFDELNESFSDLFHKLEKSKNEVIELKTSEMHAQILALQSQMNPHFLYNTLSVINASAIEENYEKTSELCTRLSSMLRYSSSFHENMVTLGEELQHARDYLALMKERFEDGFTYSINCDEELQQLFVPKVIFQPLIENSFQHGFKKKRPPWHIHINVLHIKEYWILEITDNGTGFHPDRLSQLKQRLHDYFENPSNSISSFEFGGLALLNILIRLKYLYKDKLIFNVINLENNEGTTIQIGGPVYDKDHAD